MGRSGEFETRTLEGCFWDGIVNYISLDWKLGLAFGVLEFYYFFFIVFCWYPG